MKNQEKDIPEVLAQGLEIYKEQDARAAVEAWSRGSAQDGSHGMDEKIRSLRQVEQTYGPYQKYRVEEVQKITPTAHLIFITLFYEKTEVTARFLAYKQGQHWILANFLFDISLQATRAFVV